MKATKILSMLFFLSVCSYGATINVSGPTTVCPGIEYSYSATATNIFGSQDGCFTFIFSVNGNIVGTAGGITCPCYRQSSSFTTNFTWPSTGSLNVTVRFLAKNNPICPDLSYGYLNGIVRVVVPERVYDNNGGLSVCGSNQTRLISVPTVFYNDPNICYWHHAYDWLVPSGWTVLPPSGISYTSIPGGIRTHSTTVNVTTPSTTLASGFTGNYFLTVKTEPAWPYPKEVTRQFWVGSYGTSLQISGSTQICPGNIYTYTATPPGGHQSPGHTYQWTKPSNWTIQSQAQNYITLYVPQYNPNYGPVSVSTNNGCGTAQNSLTTFPGYNCGGGYFMSIYPNPTSEELSIEMSSLDENSDSNLMLIDEVCLVKSNGDKVLCSTERKSKIVMDVKNLKKGEYFLFVKIGEELTKRQIVIN